MGRFAGFGITFKQMFKPRVTGFYPREKRPKPPRFHGRHVLNRYEDGMEKCIGCELCAWACPADAMILDAGPQTGIALAAWRDGRFSSGEAMPIRFCRTDGILEPVIIF